MATVHPSRMGLVPQDPKNVYPDRRRARSPSPRARSPPRRSDRERDNDKHRDQNRSRDRDRRRDDKGERVIDSVEDRRRGRGEDRREREKSVDRGRGDRGWDDRRDRDRDRDQSKERHRGSPEYSDYKRPATPPSAEVPWRNQENMYPNQQGRERPPHTGGSYGGGRGSEYLEGRRAEREASTLSIWPPSPKAPVRTLSPSRDTKSRRKSKRDRSETPTDSSDSEDERRRKERKQRKRMRKEKERAERKEKKEKKSRPSSRHRSYDSEEDRERRRRSKSYPRSPSPSRTPSPPRASEEDEWVEKPATAPFASSSSIGQSIGSMKPPDTIPSHTGEAADEDSDEDGVGPQPLHRISMKKFDERAYGSALLRGEGSAMAAFLQDDTDSRIPRRGEIGLTSDEIAQFESVGYVMSGSRHKRMNAVRMRKENQVISAEEKRGILKLQKDERQRREAILREEFGELVKEKLKGPQVQPK